MTPERWQSVKDLHARARRLPTRRARALLLAECADGPEIRSEVEALLAGGGTDGFLEGSLFDEHR